MRAKPGSGPLLAVALAAVVSFPFTAHADDTVPGSSEGGKPGPGASADVKIATELPKRITVDNTSEQTEVTAKVLNKGSKDTGRITLSVVGFDGMRITGVPGCVPIPAGQLPPGSNSGFDCVIDNISAGKDRTYKVSATFDLQKTGKICLPVTEGSGKKLLWQQGPVPFGASNPTPNAPDTPLLLGVDNKPSGPDTPSELPRTGASDSMLPLTGAGVMLLAAGGAGLWWTTRRNGRKV
ncbi:hypothetical protein GCM10020367_22930 [Streptomyces sannanensis]|uniref:Gram-positive cocci surface proteins LPxTG domain-containing protein n=1 Tax=Streptomyces sannanensis TaxID=285536 RepID=A0ABP6S9L4_9ACTN